MMRPALWTLFSLKNRDKLRKPDVTDPVLREVRAKGFAILENYRDREFCDSCAADLKSDLITHPDKAHLPKGGELNDSRIFGWERMSSRCASFANDPRLTGFARDYTSFPTSLGFTMANLVDRPSEYGSGGTWHRDQFKPQLKCMLYLSDVTPENGPFQIIADSHVWGKSFKQDHRDFKLCFLENRLREVGAAIEKKSPQRVYTITAKAGTLIVFDVTAIHKGAPLRSGERVALTNYYAADDELTPELFEKFAPVVR
jgi:hypothetical protein